MVAPNLADAADLEQWADRMEARHNLPALIRRLVLATSSPNRLEFRAQEGTGYAGWDGFVDNPAASPFVPEGVSAWEMGAGEDPAAKVTKDYNKRTRTPRPFDRAKTTFVFCTPRRWEGKDAWVQARLKRTTWAGIRVYDADDIATWLESAPGVHVWLSMALGKPLDGVHDLATWWQGWATVTSPPISANLLLSGRRKQQDELAQALAGKPSAIKLKADSWQEATAFLASVASIQPPHVRDAMIGRTLLVHKEGNWRYFASQSRPLILIPTFTDDGLISQAVQKGHHVLVPVGADHRLPVQVTLPRLNPVEAKAVLEMEGLAPAAATHAAALARRSLPAYRRIMASTVLEIPAWATGESGPQIIAPLLAGAWSDAVDGDREALERLAGLPYKEVNAVLMKWRDSSDPPFRQVGSKWHASAKEDAWRLLASFATSDTLRVFYDLVVAVLAEPDPNRGLPNDKRMVAEFQGVRKRYSPELRMGLADSVAMFGVLGAGDAPVALGDGSSSASCATSAVRTLLAKAVRDPGLWLDLAPNLPALAEADPDTFLQVLEDDLHTTSPTVLSLFEPQPGLISPNYGYPDLLWALENLSWSAALFSRVALVLARLEAAAPKTDIVNSPMNSLHAFFRLWLPQGGASSGLRCQTLDLMRSQVPEVAWSLMLELLPGAHDSATLIGDPGARAVLWRAWPSEVRRISGQELASAIEAVSGRVLDDAAIQPVRWVSLIPALPRLFPGHFERALRQLRVLTEALSEGDIRTEVWNQVRDLVSVHRAHAGGGWAQSGRMIDELENIAEVLAPRDPALRLRWLFASKVSLPVDYQVEDEELKRRRVDAVCQIVAHGGVDAVLAFSETVERPDEVGDSLFALGIDDKATENLLLALTESPGSRLETARGFVWRAVRAGGDEWRRKFLSLERISEWSEDTQATALLLLPLDATTLDALEAMSPGVQARYWRGFSRPWTEDPHVFARVIEGLLRNRRPRVVVGWLASASYRKSLSINPTAVLRSLTESLTTPQDDDATRISAHDVRRLLEWLRQRPDVTLQELTQLEWMYLPLLNDEGVHLALHDKLSSEPAFFVEVMGIVRRRDEPEPAAPTVADELRDRAAVLLDTWHQAPGLRDDNTLEDECLRQWVRTTVSLLEVARLRKSGLTEIGKVLSRGPSPQGGKWPHPAICDLIQDLASDRVDRGFFGEVRDSMGFSSRGMYDGGQQERDQAKVYEAFAQNLNERWPRVAAIMRKLAFECRDDAVWHDHDAEVDLDRFG